MPAEQELNGVDNESHAADIENPKGQHRQREAKVELDQPRARQRRQGEGQILQPRQPVKIAPQPEHRDADRHDGERRVHQSRGGVEMKAVEAIAQRLEQQRVDLALANILRDLEIVLRRRGGRVDQDHDDEVRDHALERVPGERLLPGKCRLPEKNRAEQRHETHRHAQQKIPAIDELALHAQVENLGLDTERCRKHPRNLTPKK